MKSQKKERQPTILIMAGGTGGHVIPALVVASALQAKGYQVHWLGTQKGLESKLVPEKAIPISYFSISGIRGKGWKCLFGAPFKIVGAIWQAVKVFRKLKPVAALSMGGYVAGPGGISAFLTRTPLLLHEQNAIPGLTNKLLAPLATVIMTAFPNVFSSRFSHKMTQTGNPITKQIIKLVGPNQRFALRSGTVHLLVLGGSLGARAINELIPKTIALLPKNCWPDVYHQTGPQDYERVSAQYRRLAFQVKLESFITDMAAAYDWADIVICRAGALTVAEIAMVGITSILIPFPYAVDDHQTENARYLSQVHAAYLMHQSEITPEKLSKLLITLIQNPNLRLKMAVTCRKLAQFDATEQIVKNCLEVSSV